MTTTTPFAGSCAPGAPACVETTTVTGFPLDHASRSGVCNVTWSKQTRQPAAAEPASGASPRIAKAKTRTIRPMGHLRLLELPSLQRLAWTGSHPRIIRSVDRQDGPPQAGLAGAPYELWFGFAASLVPQALAAVLGGYGRIITILPIAATVSIVDLAAVAAAAPPPPADPRAGPGAASL